MASNPGGEEKVPLWRDQRFWRIAIQVIAIVLGVDRLMDMMRTVLNVVGDSVAAVAVAKWEGELDIAAYRANKRSEGAFEGAA